MSYPPGQQPPTWSGQQPPAWGQGQPPAWNQGQPPGWGPPPYYSVAPRKAGTSPAFIVAIFSVALVAIAGIAAAFTFLGQPQPPKPPCVPPAPCAPQPSLPRASGRPTPLPNQSPGRETPRPTTSGGSPQPTLVPQATPISDSPAVILGGSKWQSPTLGYAFEYDAGTFQVSDSGDEFAVLNLQSFDAQVIVDGTADPITPLEMVDRELAMVDTFLIGRTKDKDSYDAILGPSIGYVRGESAVYTGILTDANGSPTAPGGVTILASTNGRITVAVVVIVAHPDDLVGTDTLQYTVRGIADDILKSFDWGTAP